MPVEATLLSWIDTIARSIAALACVSLLAWVNVKIFRRAFPRISRPLSHPHGAPAAASGHTDQP
jgi:hypothetical protein